MIWYGWFQSDENPTLHLALSHTAAARRQMFDQPPYKRSRSWRKPSATEPLGRLEFRTVPL